MVLVAAGEAHSGAVDMNGSLEQRLREDPMDSMMFSGGFSTNSESLEHKTPLEGWQFLGLDGVQEDFVSQILPTKRWVSLAGDLLFLGFWTVWTTSSEDRYICGVWVPMAAWAWERSWMCHWPGGRGGIEGWLEKTTYGF